MPVVTRPGVEQAAGDVVRVGVVGVPAPDQEVEARALLERVQERGHVGRLDGDLDTQLRPGRAKSGEQGAVAVLQHGVDRGPELELRRDSGRRERLSGLIGGHRVAAPSRVVAQEAGRDQAHGRSGEAPQRPPHEIARPHDAGERAAHGVVAHDGAAAAVEQHEVAVARRGLDQAVTEARVAEDSLEVLGHEVAGEIDLARTEAPGHRRGREAGAELERSRAAADRDASSPGCARGRSVSPSRLATRNGPVPTTSPPGSARAIAVRWSVSRAG